VAKSEIICNRDLKTTYSDLTYVTVIINLRAI
jgi:hypothetical protein